MSELNDDALMLKPDATYIDLFDGITLRLSSVRMLISLLGNEIKCDMDGFIDIACRQISEAEAMLTQLDRANKQGQR